MPRVARAFRIFEALGATTKKFSAFEYPEAFIGTIDCLGTQKLREDEIVVEIVTVTPGVSVSLSATPVNKVRHVIACGYRTDQVGTPNLTLGLSDAVGGNFCALDNTKLLAAVFQWYAPPNLPFIIPEQSRLTLISSASLNLRIQARYVELGLGEYVRAV